MTMSFNVKALGAFKNLGAVALITATIFFTACKQTSGGGGKPTPTPAPKPKHAITFSVDGANGKLKAKADGIDETEKSPITVEEGKTVTFTATPKDGYRVKEWKVDNATIEGNKTNTYTHTVKKPATVSVSFEVASVEGGAVLILNPDNLTIKVKATTADGFAITVEGCTETTLTSDVETELHAKGTSVVLKGKIIKLYSGGTLKNRQSLTALNVQGCAFLQGLNCVNNQLTSLNVQGLTALQWLRCEGNQLPELNVQGLTSLQGLYCSYNQLTELNVQGLTSLQELGCAGNQLTELNVQGLTSLQGLYCHSNQLTELNLQGLTSLQKLRCINNKLTSLNVQGCTSLQELWCYENQLPELNVQGLTSLQNLCCFSNQLTSLNVQGCASLQRLYCSSNQLTELNVQGLTALKELWCYSNQLNAEAMTKLLNALPTRQSSYIEYSVLYTEETGVTEGNCKDYTQPAELKAAFEGAKSRRWYLAKFNTSGDEVDI